jgi:hypothetical protein
LYTQYSPSYATCCITPHPVSFTLTTSLHHTALIYCTSLHFTALQGFTAPYCTIQHLTTPCITFDFSLTFSFGDESLRLRLVDHILAECCKSTVLLNTAQSASVTDLESSKQVVVKPASQGANLNEPFQMFESFFDVNLTGVKEFQV